LQAILGIQPDAPRERLYVDPVLPRWLPDITLSDLRLGRRHFDIHFWREGEDTKFEVLRGDRRLVQQQRSVEVFEMLRTGKAV
jgi:cellobiose phosphorylase